MDSFKIKALGCVSAAALMVATADHAFADGQYLSGDFHNHTTCSDGSTSVRTLTDAALTYLDWFIQAGHSGSGNRDCRFDDGAQSGLSDTTVYWSDTIGNDAIEGLQANGLPQSLTGRMWRWQSLQQYTYPEVTAAGEGAHKPAFVGLEWIVPGHEHTSSSVITDQYPIAGGNDNGMAQFEYCFASASDDTSGGGGQGWRCEIDSADNAKLYNRFKNDPNQGHADYNASLDPATGININDDGDHVKSTAAIYWMEKYHPGESYAVQAHLERAGPFRPGGNYGYNVEDLRDWNNAAPDVAFGFESQPGHQASSNRGEYSNSRSGGSVASSGLFTFGGTGCYAAGVAGKPGFNVDGTKLTRDEFHAGGKYGDANVPDTVPLDYITVCEPGIATMWDAMLTEGRKFWFFASSDWHNRGNFFFTDPATTQDFLPGEYQKTHVFVTNNHVDDPAQDIVDGLRSGNSYATMGNLITQLDFKVCYGSTCATMGQTLNVPYGADATVTIRFLDPTGPNNSPYTFPNPALTQIGISEPLNMPTVRHVDLIKGYVRSKLISTTSADYTNPQPVKPVEMLAKFTADGKGKRQWTDEGNGWKSMSFVLRNIKGDKYVRIRGSNMPAGTPYERDADGNPIRDDIGTNNIPCADAACPAHVDGKFDMDVEAWGDLWFYSNPIFVHSEGSAADANDTTDGNPS